MIEDEKVADVAVEKAEDAGDKDNNNEKNGTAGIEKTVQVKRKKKPNRRHKNEEDRQRMWEEEQAKKPVIETAVKGKVKWYSVRNHYGFIERDGDEANDVFVHQTAISKSRMHMFYLRSLDETEEVTFDVVEGRRGLEAANVTGPDGAAVRGNPMAGIFMMRRLWARREQRGDDDVRRDTDERQERRRVSSLGSELKGLQLNDENAAEGKGQKRRVRNAKGRRLSEGDKEGKKGETVKEEGKKKEGRKYRRKSGGKRGQRRSEGNEEKVETEHEAEQDVKEEKQKDVSDIGKDAGRDVEADSEKEKKGQVGEEETEHEPEEDVKEEKQKDVSDIESNAGGDVEADSQKDVGDDVEAGSEKEKTEVEEQKGHVGEEKE